MGTFGLFLFKTNSFDPTRMSEFSLITAAWNDKHNGSKQSVVFI